jgi:nucleotide-binding universal stress UspA family protein
MDIVVGYIQSPEGDAALERAIQEARLRQGRVVVVHSKTGGDEDPGSYLRSAEALERVEDRLREAGVEHETHEFVRGRSPAQDLIETVEQYGAGLIVIGIRTRSSTGKFLLGSNALDILHDATVPVLCVKAH